MRLFPSVMFYEKNNSNACLSEIQTVMVIREWSSMALIIFEAHSLMTMKLNQKWIHRVFLLGAKHICKILYEKLTSLCYLSRGLNGEDISFFFKRLIEIILSRVFHFACFKQTLFTAEICDDFYFYYFFWLLNITYNGNYQETEIFSWFLKRLFTW